MLLHFIKEYTISTFLNMVLFSSKVCNCILCMLWLVLCCPELSEGSYHTVSSHYSCHLEATEGDSDS